MMAASPTSIIWNVYAAAPGKRISNRERAKTASMVTANTTDLGQDAFAVPREHPGKNQNRGDDQDRILVNQGEYLRGDERGEYAPENGHEFRIFSKSLGMPVHGRFVLGIAHGGVDE
jgi:hypothetical protein